MWQFPVTLMGFVFPLFIKKLQDNALNFAGSSTGGFQLGSMLMKNHSWVGMVNR